MHLLYCKIYQISPLWKGCYMGCGFFLRYADEKFWYALFHYCRAWVL